MLLMYWAFPHSEGTYVAKMSTKKQLQLKIIETATSNWNVINFYQPKTQTFMIFQIRLDLTPNFRPETETTLPWSDLVLYP